MKEIYDTLYSFYAKRYNSIQYIDYKTENMNDNQGIVQSTDVIDLTDDRFNENDLEAS